MSPEMIVLNRVSKSFDGGKSFAVKELDLRVREREFLVLLGESGCGKTTTLRMTNRLIEPTSGQILIDGEDISTVDPIELRRGIGYVFQGIGLFPHWDVAGNVAAVPRLLGLNDKEIGRRVSEMLELVGLPPGKFRNRRVQELSGGQQQRVGVARALAGRPMLLLMDEPFGALDPITRAELQDEFQSLQREMGLTVVLVTHDITEALLLADRIAVMRDGRKIREGTPFELMSNPADDYVERLIESPLRTAAKLSEMLSATSAPGDGGGASVENRGSGAE